VPPPPPGGGAPPPQKRTPPPQRKNHPQKNHRSNLTSGVQKIPGRAPDGDDDFRLVIQEPWQVSRDFGAKLADARLARSSDPHCRFEEFFISPRSLDSDFARFIRSGARQRGKFSVGFGILRRPTRHDPLRFSAHLRSTTQRAWKQRRRTCDVTLFQWSWIITPDPAAASPDWTSVVLRLCHRLRPFERTRAARKQGFIT